MTYRRLTAGILALGILFGAGAPANEGLLTVLTASAQESAVEGTYEDLTYLNYGDHIEITKCYQWAKVVTIPDDIDGVPVTVIADGAFKNCKTLSTVYFGKNITEIGDEAFYGCTQLINFTMPTKLERIGDRAFAECRNTDAFVFYDKLTEIGEEAFAGSWTRTVVFPESLTKISKGAFSRCDRLSTVCIPATITRIEADAFSECNVLQNILYKGSSEDWAALSIASGNEILSTLNIQCDYNKILVDREHTYIEGMDNWNFLNRDLEYYYLSEESYASLAATLGKTEMTLVDYVIEDFADGYGGACAGMALTTLLACGGVLDPADWQEGAASLYELELNDEIRDLITYYFVLQMTDCLQIGNIDSSDELIATLEVGTPVYFSFFGDLAASEGDTNIYGHAVVAYGVEYGEWTYGDITYTGRLLIYDNNAGGFADDNCLYFTEDWEEYTIPYYSPTRLYMGSTLSDLDAINLHGLNCSTDYVQPERTAAILSTLSLPEGFTIEKEGEDGSFAAMAQEDAGLTTDGCRIKFTLSDTQGSYALAYDELQDMDLSMAYEECLLLTDASNAQRTVFAPSGAVSISGADMDYSIDLIFDEGAHFTDWYECTVTGSGTDYIAVQPTEYGYLLTGESLDGTEILTSGNAGNAALTLATDAQEVMVYAVDAGTLRAYIDTDGDGSFETVIGESTASLGDADSSGLVDATDASLILIAAAEAGAGAQSSLFLSQLNAADVNADSTFDANDAALVLEYAAYAGTGGMLSIEDYLAQ